MTLTSVFPVKPNCSLQQLYIPALNKIKFFIQHHPGISDRTRKFRGRHRCLRRSDECDLFLKSESESFHDLTIQKFCQGHGKTAVKRGVVNTSGIDREAVSVNESAAFGVQVSALMRFKIFGGKGKRHELKVGHNARIDDQGTMLHPEKSILLKSKAKQV